MGHREVFRGDEDVGRCSVLAPEETTLRVQPSDSCPGPRAASTEPPRCDPDSVVLLLCPLMKHAIVCGPEIKALCHPETMRTHVTLLEPRTTVVLLFYYGATFLVSFPACPRTALLAFEKISLKTML